jgi:hypothetical protein
MLVSCNLYKLMHNQNSNFDSMQWRAVDQTAGVRFSVGPIDFSLLHSVQDGSETHPDYYPMGTGDYFHMDKGDGS